MSKRPETRNRVWVGILLILLVTLCYLRVGSLNYIGFDDPIYVFKNPHVQSGLTMDNITWSLTAAGYAGNWHPLSWVSHMVDYELYGPNPAGHHLANAAIHALNALLLFLLLSAMTGSVWRSAFVAALFGVHPLNVESVAWIAERKSTLSTLFWIGALWAYWKYSQKPNLGRYALTALLFALGLAAKPMLVTLPIVLLILDYWPLNRSNIGWRKLALEKVPLLALVAASCWITLIAQNKLGLVRPLEDYPLGVRIANAAVSYSWYIRKMLWPSGLCVMYPHFGTALPTWLVVVSGSLLAGATYAAVRVRRSLPYVTAGWFWYVVTLVPVIGIVQVGPQAMADRYAYVPLIGIFVIITWGTRDVLARLVGSSRRTASVLAVPAAGVIVAFAVCTWVQIGYWRDTDTVFGHAVEVTHNHPQVTWSWSSVLIEEGHMDEAISRLRNLLRVYGWQAQTTHYLLGSVYGRDGKLDEAISEYRAALRIDPKMPYVQNNLGTALGRQGKIGEAMARLAEAIRLKPNYADPHHSLGVLLLRQGKIDEAIEQFNQALRIDPKLGDTRMRLALALSRNEDYTGAWQEVHKAQRLGATPDPQLIADLSSKMPEPRE